MARKPAKPSYLGLLNAIAVGEAAAEPLFAAWADRARDEQLADTLRLVALREGEHAKAFAKRMYELGFEVRQPTRPGPDPELMAVVESRRSDLKKFEALGFEREPTDGDVFDGMFADRTIDPQTGALLGRYIAEERDTVRRLAAEYRRLGRVQAKEAKARQARKARKADQTAADEAAADAIDTVSSADPA